MTQTIPLVKISAVFILLSTLNILIVPLATCLRKKWYGGTAMCLDRGVILGEVAKIKAPLLSSNTDEYVDVRKVGSFINNDATYSTKDFSGRRLRILALSAIYSASIVERAISVCRQER